MTDITNMACIVYLYKRPTNYYCQAQVQSQIQVPNPNHKTKVQRKGTWTGADTPNFSHLKCQSSERKRPSMTFLDLP